MPRHHSDRARLAGSQVKASDRPINSLAVSHSFWTRSKNYIIVELSVFTSDVIDEINFRSSKFIYVCVGFSIKVSDLLGIDSPKRPL